MVRVLVALLLLAALVAPAAQAVPAQVFRVNPPVGLRDGAFRDNALSLESDAFAGALMDVELAPFSTVVSVADGVAWGNERFTMMDTLAMPDGSTVRRDDPRFLERMAWFYLNHAVDRLEALGYGVPFEQPLRVWPHQSYVDGTVPTPVINSDAYCCGKGLVLLYRALSLNGQGGMGSTAEDADVIVHELGHYLHNVFAPGIKYDPDTYGPYAEGTADLFATLLLDDLSQGVGDACVGEWISTYYPASFTYEKDGFACLRTLENNLVWPKDDAGSIHKNGQFWSGAMWRVRGAIGTDATLRLLVEALPLLTNTSFEGLGAAVLRADAALYDGRHETLIRDSFAAKGIALPTLAELLAGRPVPQPRVADPTFTATPTDDGASGAGSRGSPAGGILAVVVLAGIAFLRRRD